MMTLQEKLKGFEGQYMFLRWATGAEYGKLSYVGEDFVEFDILDVDTMDYQETTLVNRHLVLEAIVGGVDIARIIAEVSSKISE